MKRTLMLLATTALAAGMVFAQAVNHPNRRAMARQRMEQALNLTDAQRAQAKTIFQSARQEAKPWVAQLKQDRAALKAAVKSDNLQQIDKLATARGQVMGKLMAARSEAMAKFYQILTPEQRAKADQMHQQRRQQWRQRHEVRG